MPAMKDMSKVSAKWSRVAGQSGPSYQEGVESPRKDWQTATKAANANWEAGTQQAITQKRFQKGVEKSSTANWQSNAINKGVSRYSAGVQLSQGKYEAGFSPYAQVITTTTLPERFPKGDARNINRVSVMAKALHDKKLSISGVSTK